MDYFKVLNLEREPFSNSPEPAFFYQSTQHLGCLQQLELAVRLRRGLNVVIGEVGTGKTTLCRELIQRLSLVKTDSEVFETHLILDPSFNNTLEFLTAVAGAFGISDLSDQKTEWQFKEEIKNALFQKGVDEGKIIVLIIDEGQKIPEFCLEILREFLNYETNEYKLLQIVIFAQMEFAPVLKNRINLTDRINLYYHLKPLNFRESREMILFRLQKAGPEGTTKPPAFFTFPGFIGIYRETRGYPRKINMLCHQMLLAMIIQNRSRGGWWLAHSCAGRTNAFPSQRSLWPAFAALLVLAAIVMTGVILWPNFNKVLNNHSNKVPTLKQAVRMMPAARPVPVAAGKEKLFLPDLDKRAAPALLGSLKVMKGRTVTSMVKTIYGGTDYSLIKAVLHANPEIENLDQVISGSVLRFPAIPATPSPPTGTVRVAVSFEKTLEAAYEAAKRQNGRSPSVRLLPYWNRQEGLIFAILLRDSFPDKASAMEALQRMPPSQAQSMKIIEQFDPSTIFFSRT